MKCNPLDKCTATLDRLGVNIVDADGSMLAGISERQAIALHKSLAKLLPRIEVAIKKRGL